MTTIDIFNKFCKYVDDSFFPEENVGSYIAFVIEQSFIDEFCSSNNISETELMSSVKKNIHKRDILSVKGIIAIQLFAASKRVSNNEVTNKNYRYQLSQILDWEINELQSWMSQNQDELWNTLYRWCDSHFYKITKCYSREGAWRYTQYPVRHAQCVFTEEDLRYIAAYFVEKKLQKDEDIQENEFWRIIHPFEIKSYVVTNHGKEVIKNSLSDDEYKNQVFNYFLRWDGVYKTKKKYENEKTIRTEKERINYLIYMDEDFSQIDVRNNHLSLIKTFLLGEITINDISKYYTFKRNNTILFKKDDIYDNMWCETRYLEKGENGIIVYIKDNASKNEFERRRLENLKFIKENSNVIIYKIDKYTSLVDDFYEKKRPYKLEGGLKIGRNTYLLNAGPFLTLEEKTQVWLDGNLLENEELKHNLNNLPEGIHRVVIPNYKRIFIEIVKETLPQNKEWNASYNKWKFDKKKNLWETGKYEDGIVGLDYSIIPQGNRNVTKPILRRWSESMLCDGECDKKENNIGIRIIK